jgi:hypothetical protein
MGDNVNENVIEFLRNQETATVCFSQPRYISKIKELAQKYPKEVTITAENADGSIVAHVPTKWVRISAPRKMTEEQREKCVERLAQYRK